jgi:hypothetical protein
MTDTVLGNCNGIQKKYNSLFVAEIVIKKF